METSGVGTRPLPLAPRSGTRRTPGGAGGGLPGSIQLVPLPQTRTSAPRPARVWRGVASTQVRDPGAPPPLGHPRVLKGSRGREYAGMAGEGAVGDAVDQVPLPRIHLGAGEGPGRGWGRPVPGASCPSSTPPHGSGPAEVGGGAHPAGRTPPPPPRFLGLCCRCARAPRLPHCGSRGPINRESDVLGSREWRGPGSWGRGRAEPQAPAPPPPGHVSWAPGSHPPVTC